MLLSIICPLFNKERYVVDMIKSVLRQTSANWELIIIDDGSTDNSYAIASEFQENNPDIKLYRRTDFKEAKGAAVCRNIGISHAKGNFIMFLDADDLLAPFCVEQRLDCATKGMEGLDFLIFKTAEFKNSPPKLQRKRNGNFKLIRGKENHFIKKFCKQDLPWNISAVLWKREAFKKNKGFIEAFARLQDPELHLRSLLLGLKCAVVDGTKADVLYRIDENRRSISHFELLKIYVVNTKLFLEVFTKLMENKNRGDLKPLLTGYIVRVEQYALFWANVDYENRKLYEFELKKLYDSEVVKKTLTPTANFLIRTMRSLSKFRILFRIRYHSILVQLYLKLLH